MKKLRNNKGSIYAIEALIILPALMFVWMVSVEITSYLSFRNRMEQIVFTAGDILPASLSSGRAAAITQPSISETNIAIQVMAGGRFKDIHDLSAVLVRRTDRKCWKDWKQRSSDVALPDSLTDGAFAGLRENLCAAFAVDGVVSFRRGGGGSPQYGDNETSDVSVGGKRYLFAYTPDNNSTNAYGQTIRSLTYSICGIEDLLPSTGVRCAGFGGDRNNISNPSFSNTPLADQYYNKYNGSGYAPHPTPLILTSYRPTINDGQSFIIINMRATYKPVFSGLLTNIFGNAEFKKYFVSVPRFAATNTQSSSVLWCVGSRNSSDC
jgi:hypothetical protein